ncbi:RHS repeat-associated core domain-containing protein [Sphingomonas sp. KR3-1]|uniref:RHS repeat domain-containing protein n=1 Tax=Sphingomonas sp. KR3-1 TaxID=3156611 RepID=UPI0032B57C2D
MERMNFGRPRGRTGRRAYLLLATILATGVAAPAMGQAISPHPNLDANGMDLTDGSFAINVKIASVGSGDAELPLTAISGDFDNWNAIQFQKTTSGSTTHYTIPLGLKYDHFTQASQLSTVGSGAVLTDATDTATYRALDGSVITFTNPVGTLGGLSNLCDYNNTTNCYLLPESITDKGGKTVHLEWDVHQNCSLSIDAPDCTFSWRLARVYNNAGSEIDFTYASNSVGIRANPGPTWYQRTTAVLSGGGASGGTTGTVTYARPSTGVTTITTPGGRTWRFTGANALRRPGASSDTLVRSGSNVTHDGVTTNYNYSVSGTTATMVVTDAQSHTTTIVSDLTKHRPTSVTDANGKVTGYTYDSLGRPTEISYPEGNKVQYTYDGRGNTAETRLKAKPGSGLSDIVTTAGYDSSCSNPLTCNSPNWTKDALGNQTDFAYDSGTGLVTSVTRPAATSGSNRPQTRYSYTTNAAGVAQLTGISQCRTGVAPGCVGTADEVKATVAYDAALNVTSVTTAAGDGSLSATTTATYDAAGNLLTVDGPLSGSGDTVTYRYDADRLRVGAISSDPDGAGSRKRRALKTSYTSDGQPSVTEVGTVDGTTDTDWSAFVSSEQLTDGYDTNARKTREVLTAGGSTYGVSEYSYDTLGRPDCMATRMNSAAWGSALAACTAATAGSAGPDRIVRASYDAVGRRSKVQTAYGTADQSDEVTTTYTDNGELASVTDGEVNKTSYEYDGFDRPAKTYYPVSTQGTASSSGSDYEQFGYDAASNVTSRRLRDGTTITYGYDYLNRVISKVTPNIANFDWDVAYGYNLIGQATSVVGNGAVDDTFVYDALGRLTNENNYGAATYHSYDLAGRQTRLTWSDGFYVDYDYNVTGETIAIRENGATSGAGVLASYGYDDLGRRTSITRGNGTTTSYSYDGVSRLSSIAQNLAGSSYDFTHSLSYNPASQIASLTRSNDAYAWNGYYNVDRPYTVNGLNQLAAAGSTALGYDGRGNLTSSGSLSYDYTSENRLATAPGYTLAYEPGGGQLLQLHENLSGQDTRFAYSGGQLISELTYTGSSWAIAKRYVPGPSADEPIVWYEGAGTSDRRWLHADERGSVVAVSDGSGNVIGVNSYDEYGIPSGGNIGRFQYTGQAWMPEFGMYYYKARMYSPTLGRFMQADSISYIAGMNLYNYTMGDPINFNDPSGHDIKCNDGTSIPSTTTGDDACDGHGGFSNELSNGGAGYGAFSGSLLWGIIRGSVGSISSITDSVGGGGGYSPYPPTPDDRPCIPTTVSGGGYIGGSGELGAAAIGAAGQGSLSAMSFTNGETAVFKTTGAYAGGPGWGASYPSSASGLYSTAGGIVAGFSLGAGGGISATNATSPGQLAGVAQTYNANVGVVSVSASFGENGIFSVNAGLSLGFSFDASTYQTNTTIVAQQKSGC